MSRDPFPYDGPIERADGVRPYNRYLWPTEQWTASKELDDNRIAFDWRIEIVALADGRFSSSGFVHNIETGVDYYGFRCVFPMRSAAIRASAARMMCQARWRRTGRQHLLTAWTPDQLPRVVSWARSVVERETDRKASRQIRLFVASAPPRQTGLPLFDRESCT